MAQRASEPSNWNCKCLSSHSAGCANAQTVRMISTIAMAALPSSWQSIIETTVPASEFQQRAADAFRLEFGSSPLLSLAPVPVLVRRAGGLERDQRPKACDHTGEAVFDQIGNDAIDVL